jgi:multisubunit Na+/H+ antiporter MnhF subunit
VNVWLLAATVLLGGLVPCGAVALRAGELDALAALQLAGALVTVVLLLLAEGFHRSVYFVLPLALPVVSFVGTLIFVRYFEREL